MKEGKKRCIAVIVGSDSDLPQCSAGISLLVDEERAGTIEIEGVHTMSVHRNHRELCEWLDEQHKKGGIDVIIAGAGWAAHLPGMIDAILGYDHGNKLIHVIGVAFRDPESERHTQAAQLSISEVPATRVVHRDGDGMYVGSNGFWAACELAVFGDLPVIETSKPRSSKHRTGVQARLFIEGEFRRLAEEKLLSKSTA